MKKNPLAEINSTLVSNGHCSFVYAVRRFHVSNSSQKFALRSIIRSLAVRIFYQQEKTHSKRYFTPGAVEQFLRIRYEL